MKMRISKDTTSLSVEGVEYEVKDGLVDLPDNLPGPTVKCLIEGHGMETISPDEETAKPANGGKK
jgi:hypothetical protein